MPNHLYAIDSNRHPCQGASTATVGQVIKALGSDVQAWASIAGDATGSPDALQVTGLHIAGEARGDILYRGASAWVRLAANTDGLVLTTHGAGADPTWAAGGISGVDATGTNNLSWTTNKDATAAAAENPYNELLGGDGVGAPNNDIVRSRWTQDSVAEVTYFTHDRNRNAGGFTRITPTLGVGLPGSVSSFGAVFQWAGGNGAVSSTVTASLLFTATTPRIAFSATIDSAGTGGSGSTRFGELADARINGCAFGYNSFAGSTGAHSGDTAYGEQAQITGSNASAFGAAAIVTANSGVTMGGSSSVTVAGGINIGTSGNVTAAAINIATTYTNATTGLCNVGSPTLPITSFIFGKGEVTSSPGNITWAMTTPQGGVDSNTSAGTTTIKLGAGTGTGNGGDLIITAAAPGGAGNTLNTNVEIARFNDTGELGLGNIGTSPGAQLHVQNTSSSTSRPIVLLEQTSTGDASIRWLADSTNWIEGIDNSVSGNPWVLSESSALGTTDRAWIDTSAGSWHQRTHAQSTGNTAESERHNTAKLETVGATTDATLWSHTLTGRDTGTFFVYVEASRRSDDQAKGFVFACTVYRDSAGGGATIAGTNTALHAGGTASTAAWLASVKVTSNDVYVAVTADSGTVEWTCTVIWQKQNY
jgi:hypothetical protein